MSTNIARHFFDKNLTDSELKEFDEFYKICTKTDRIYWRKPSEIRLKHIKTVAEGGFLKSFDKRSKKNTFS